MFICFLYQTPSYLGHVYDQPKVSLRPRRCVANGGHAGEPFTSGSKIREYVATVNINLGRRVGKGKNVP